MASGYWLIGKLSRDRWLVNKLTLRLQVSGQVTEVHWLVNEIAFEWRQRHSCRFCYCTGVIDVTVIRWSDTKMLATRQCLYYNSRVGVVHSICRYFWNTDHNPRVILALKLFGRSSEVDEHLPWTRRTVPQTTVNERIINQHWWRFSGTVFITEKKKKKKTSVCTWTSPKRVTRVFLRNVSSSCCKQRIWSQCVIDVAPEKLHTSYFSTDTFPSFFSFFFLFLFFLSLFLSFLF